jgi:hypothetical protein
MKEDNDWDRIYKKMLINSTYGVNGSVDAVSEITKILQEELKIQIRDEKIDKLLNQKKKTNNKVCLFLLYYFFIFHHFQYLF